MRGKGFAIKVAWKMCVLLIGTAWWWVIAERILEQVSLDTPEMVSGTIVGVLLGYVVLAVIIVAISEVIEGALKKKGGMQWPSPQ